MELSKGNHAKVSPPAWGLNMKTKNTLFADLLDFDLPEATHDIVWSAGNPVAVTSRNDLVAIELPFFAHKFDGEGLVLDESIFPINHTLWIRAYGEDIVRLTLNVNDDKLPDDTANVMLEMTESLNPSALKVQQSDNGWQIVDAAWCRADDVQRRTRQQNDPRR